MIGRDFFKIIGYNINLCSGDSMHNNQTLVRELIRNIQVEVREAGHIRCPATWRDIDYVPDYNKLYLIEDGAGWINVDGRDYYPTAGQLVVMPIGVRQSFSYTSQDNTYLKYWTHFTARVGEADFFQFVRCPVLLNVPDFGEAAHLFRGLAECFASDAPDMQLMAKCYLYQILAQLVRAVGEENLTAVRGGEMARLATVLQYIDSHLADNITVEQLAGEMYLHPNYFIRLFKSGIGVSPIHYLNRKRLDRAKQLLANSSLSVSQIAEMVGFASASYFSKIFRQKMNLSPSEYREQCAGTDGPDTRNNTSIPNG